MVTFKSPLNLLGSRFVLILEMWLLTGRCIGEKWSNAISHFFNLTNGNI